MAEIGQADRARAHNAIAAAVERRQGFTVLHLRYGIAEDALAELVLLGWRPPVEARDLGKIIWETSRADEGSISATGADIIASALLASNLIGSARRAPVQSSGKAMPAGTISWGEHEQAWRGYLGRYPGSARAQDPDRIAQRGGFSRAELVMFLGHQPVTFEEARS